ncbi:Uncharacterized mitochondrial protein AtMg00310 [Striga hermonthica]|uniref:Uncharacterized mitochondrial protein AtMg00310 n=1 Tax=Striga hermonthica TaxID=68872 RepID=A0A9N7MDT3_STRHE|nr:Uncharacterized mitochondrial protein AtMg00310 [Striga hermonthica]
MIGRDKSRTFATIRERILKRLQSWRINLFSSAGREILIKAVVQSIPTYFMSLFRIPKFICDQLLSLVAPFWWGSREGERKLSWVKWSRLTLSKQLGGLGFRDLSKFNQALLGKQAWRVLSEPDSLVSRVLKSKYFPSCSFLEASLRPGSSFIWRSLLWGREVIKADTKMPTSDNANDEDASLETNDVEPLDEDESSEPELRRSNRERRSSTRYSPEEYVTVTSEGGASRVESHA